MQNVDEYFRRNRCVFGGACYFICDSRPTKIPTKRPKPKMHEARGTSLVKLLMIESYAADGWTHNCQYLKNPTWPQIESAIRQLDKFCFPFIWLHLTDNEEDTPQFEVMGGKGEYWIAGSNELYQQRRYFNADQDEYNPENNSDGLVTVWESDQGFSDYGVFICLSLDTVLQAAKYFYEYGELDPKITWEDRS